MLKRDISITLVIKFTLLFILWYCCFSKVHKPIIQVDSWFFSPQTTSPASQSSKTFS